MTVPSCPTTTRSELEDINRELADLLHVEPVELSVGADTSLQDDLIICGILGGKDVGKSTLINALAKTEVSVDQAEVGKGTERPMAYVHEAVQDQVRDRLQSIDRRVPLDVTAHDAEAIRNVVLVDLPDFDSEFNDHLDIVRAVAPLLDRVLWVVTPRKIGDRAWVRMLHDVVKDPGNVHCVLNKVDELLADDEPFDHSDPSRGPQPARGPATAQAKCRPGTAAEQFWRAQQDWMCQVVESSGCPETEDHRFLTAAAFPNTELFVERVGILWKDPNWSTYTDDRDTVAQIARLATEQLDRLRSCVHEPVSTQQGHVIKEANRKREQQANITRIGRHYDLERTAEQLAQACEPEYLQQVLNEAMGAEYIAAVEAALQARFRRDSSLADELLERRVERWPLLRLVYWPFGWLSRLLGRRVAPLSLTSDPGAGSSASGSYRQIAETDAWETGGPGTPGLAARIELMRSRVLADHAVIARRLDLESELPDAAVLHARVMSEARTLVPRLEARLIESIREADRRPSILGKAALWLVFLWFPFLQPVLAGLLEIFADGRTLQLAHGLYRIVSALSAAHLLSGFAVVVGIFVGLLAAMYARALRTVRTSKYRQDQSSPVAEAVDEILVSQVAVPLVKPFQSRWERISAIQSRLAAAATA